MKALIFDCDGVLVDTERDGHRVAFNRAFVAAGIDAEWDVDLYGELLKIAGGKERMTHYFNEVGWPEGQTAATLIPELHKKKTAIFTELIANGSLPLRPGVARIVDDERVHARRGLQRRGEGRARARRPAERARRARGPAGTQGAARGLTPPGLVEGTRR